MHYLTDLLLFCIMHTMLYRVIIVQTHLEMAYFSSLCGFHTLYPHLFPHTPLESRYSSACLVNLTERKIPCVLRGLSGACPLGVVGRGAAVDLSSIKGYILDSPFVAASEALRSLLNFSPHHPLCSKHSGAIAIVSNIKDLLPATESRDLREVRKVKDAVSFEWLTRSYRIRSVKPSSWKRLTAWLTSPFPNWTSGLRTRFRSASIMAHKSEHQWC